MNSKRFASIIKPPKSWPLIKRFWPFVRPHRRTIVVLIGVTLLTLPTGVISPLLVKYMIDNVVKTRDTHRLIYIALALAGLALISQILNYFQLVLVRRFHLLVVHRIGRGLFANLVRLPMRFYAHHDTGYVMSRMRDDLETVSSSLVETFLRIITGLIRTIVFIGLLIYLDPVLAVASMVIAILIAGVSMLFSGALRERSRIAQETTARAAGTLHEAIIGMSLIKATVREKFEELRYVRALSAVVRASFRRHYMSILAGRVLDFCAENSIYAIIVIGAYRIIKGTTTFGNLFAFAMYLTHLYGAATSLMQANPDWQNSMNSLSRIFEMMDLEPEAAGKGVYKPELGQCAIAFDHVTFGYDPEIPVLHDITVNIPAGAQVALVGPSGAGKTTFAQLIPRFYEPVRGRILLNGSDIRDMNLYELRRLIGIVSQDVFLFNRSVADNIAYGNHVSDRSLIERAAATANAEEFILDLPDKYNTEIGERGVRLSAGQKQRLAIAREMLRNPPIMILDETTSSLDSVSESLIQDALQRLKRNRTWIVIAHRLSTVIESDWILVFDKGRIVEQGSHSDLLAMGGFYSVLFETQFKRGFVLSG
ncbi:MAG TPA: ABC transporter ATP-binding protein [Blastocatellia bacterium]